MSKCFLFVFSLKRNNSCAIERNKRISLFYHWKMKLSFNTKCPKFLWKTWNEWIVAEVFFSVLSGIQRNYYLLSAFVISCYPNFMWYDVIKTYTNQTELCRKHAHHTDHAYKQTNTGARYASISPPTHIHTHRSYLYSLHQLNHSFYYSLSMLWHWNTLYKNAEQCTNDTTLWMLHRRGNSVVWARANDCQRLCMFFLSHTRIYTTLIFVFVSRLWFISHTQMFW